jgi:structural maintenance of chromosome 1
MVQAKKAYDAHMEDIAELERELAEVDKKRQDYEDTIAGESQQQGRPLLTKN